MLERNVTLSFKGCVQGALLCVPGFPGVVALGMVFGTVAAQKGLTFLETIMINSLVFAGASQFVAMEVYSDPLTWGSLIAMVGVTAAVNMRMLLIGASLRPVAWTGAGLQDLPSPLFPDRFELAHFSFRIREGDPGLGHLSRQRFVHLDCVVTVCHPRLFRRKSYF
jgi:hypothetical protein